MAVVAAPTAAAAAPVDGAQTAAFSGKPAVQDVEAACLAYGEARGRVLVAASVRYADASRAGARRYARGRHTVRSSIAVLGPGGAVLAADRDRGRAQVSIPSLAAYTHVHHHLLSAVESRRVMGGRPCGAGARAVRVRVRATQLLSTRGRATSAATDTQGASDAVSTAVDPTATIPSNINGCVSAGGDWNCHGVNLDGQDLSGFILAYGDFSFASMRNANLQGARLGHVIMNLTVLDGANMQKALFGSASLTSASLLGADLTGAEGPFANLANAKLGTAKLAGVNLGGANLQGTVFDNSACDDKTKFPVAFPHRCVNGVIAPG